MKNYNEEYYIIVEADTPISVVFANEQSNNKEKRAYQKKMDFDKPLKFHDFNKKKNKKKKLTIPDMLFSLGNPIVNKKTYEFLNQFDIDGVQLYPAIFIDNDDNWIEGLYYMHLYKSLDCWDRERSVSDLEEEIEYFEESKHRRPAGIEFSYDTVDVEKYHLDEKILDKIPEEQRLIFLMGNTSDDHIFIHQKVLDFLLENKITGFKYYKVSEYDQGEEFYDEDEDEYDDE